MKTEAVIRIMTVVGLIIGWGCAAWGFAAGPEVGVFCSIIAALVTTPLAAFAWMNAE